MANPGSAGLTADRLGDSDKWTVPANMESSSYAGDVSLEAPGRVDKTRPTT